MGDKARGGQIVMMNGDPTDPNAGWFKQGALSVLKGKVKIGRSYDTAEWRPENALQATCPPPSPPWARTTSTASVRQRRPRRRRGHRPQGRRVKPLPPVTGQDADLAAVRRIVKGEQYMTVYKPFEPEADAAAEMAVALGRGEKLDTIATDTRQQRHQQGRSRPSCSRRSP